MFPALYNLNKQHNDKINLRTHHSDSSNHNPELTVKELYTKAFYAGREVQIKEQSGEEVDGRAVWNELEITTKGLKDQTLTYRHEILNYNLSLIPIYSEMRNIIIEFGMDESEFNPKSNHFFCQLMNLVDKKSKFEIKLNKIMQLGFNAGQLSIFLERNTLPVDRSDIITEFIERNNMLDINTYVSLETQQIINSKYLHAFNGGKKKCSRKNRNSNIVKSRLKKTGSNSF